VKVVKCVDKERVKIANAPDDPTRCAPISPLGFIKPAVIGENYL